MSIQELPLIAISTGDPAGVGPEIVVKALADKSVRELARWIVVGENWVLDRATSMFTWSPDRVLTNPTQTASDARVTVLEERELVLNSVQIGQISAECGAASVRYVKTATQLCLANLAAAIVTAPINKEAVSLSGDHFTGHTEYIAELCGAQHSRMLLVNDRMRVVHVTTHCSLAEAATIDQGRVYETLQLGHRALQRLGWAKPRLGVCGLNPHAGENGLFGNQETTVIEPAILKARSDGIDCSGPFPADTLFLQAYRGRFDLVVAMYHDQGHVPMKLLDFEHTVNVSLGLPIIRTSVDHGTAFDIAGKDQADSEDMKSAIRLAVKMATGGFCSQKDNDISHVG